MPPQTRRALSLVLLSFFALAGPDLDGLEKQGTWTRDKDTFTSAAREEGSSLYFGSNDWKSCELDCHVTPISGGSVQVALRDASITTYVDGKIVNHVTDCDNTHEHIGFIVWNGKTSFRNPRYRRLS